MNSMISSVFVSSCILLFSGVLLQCNGIRWLGLYRFNRDVKLETENFSQMECKRAKGFGIRRQQMLFCRDDKKSFAMHAIFKASQAVAFYCPKVFEDRRWNCTNVQRMPHVTPDLKKNTREQAVVHAFSSAAVVYEIARRCSQSLITHCYCGLDSIGKMTAPENHRWGGCSDNLETGELYAQDFLGYRKRRGAGKRSRKKRRQQPPRGGSGGESMTKLKQRRRRKKRPLKIARLIKSHNYKVGVQIMKYHRKTICKCMGVSGSCANRICFSRLKRIDTEDVKSLLRQQYLKAKYVFLLGRGGGGNGKLVSSSFENGVTANKQVEPLDLVYSEHSPDYCEPDSRVGSAGTKGRSCRLNVEQHVPDHCHTMCCGRGHITQNITEVKSCQCRVTTKFNVLCNNCTVHITKYYCQ